MFSLHFRVNKLTLLTEEKMFNMYSLCRIEYYREGIAEITDKLIHAYQIYAIEGTREGRKIF